MRTAHGPHRVALLAGALALGASSALFGVSPALAAPVTVAGGSLDWGFKASFRAYVSSGNGNPPIAVSDGATRNADGTFDFAAKGGTYDAAAGTADVDYKGTVVFSYPAHMFEITLKDPSVVVAADGTGSLVADVTLVAYGEETSQQDAEIATLTGATPSVTGGGITISNAAATLTAAGAGAFAGFYSAGTALDAVTASASSTATEPGNPSEPPEEPAEPPAGNDTAAQKINAVVSGGALTLTSAGGTVALSAATPGQSATGSLNAVTVSDLRGTSAGWDLVGQVTDFTSAAGATLPAANLGWTPSASVVTSGLKAATGAKNAVAPGGEVAPGTGLGTSRTLCSAETGSSLGSSTCGAALELGVPESSAAGEYSAVLTLTLA
jgi:hypothetical protein